MSTEQPTGPAPEAQADEQPTSTESPSQPQSSNLVDELTTLGRKFGVAIQTALNSPQWQQVETEVREGFHNVVTEVNDALAKARSTDAAKQVGEQATKVVDSVRSSKVTSDVRDSFLKGMKAVNRELDEVIARMEPKAAEADAESEPSEPPA